MDKENLDNTVSASKFSNWQLGKKGNATNQIAKKKTMFIMGILIIVIVGGLAYSKMTGNAVNNGGAKMVVLETNYGNIAIQLYGDMPITAGNFEKLVKQGFYDGVIFHRIIDGFMIQGGDPQGTGMGGPGYTIKDELTHAGGNKNNRGTISMANAGPNTGGSQFFINTVNNNFLDTKHPAFGEVVQGMDVVDKISKVSTDSCDRPLQVVKIISAKISIVE